MWIVCLTSNPNGSHNDHRANHITAVPDGWAMIPDALTVPDTFPFVDIEAAELTYTEDVCDESENVIKEEAYTMMTVISMTEGKLPEANENETEPTETEDTAAMLVDHEYRLTLLELGLTEY